MNVNRTNDALHWYRTTVGLWTTVILLCTITGVIAGIYLGGPSLGPDVNKSDKADGGTQQSGTGSSSHATSAQVGMRAFAVEVNEQPAVSEEETQDVIVAARDFKEKEILKPDMVRSVDAE